MWRAHPVLPAYAGMIRAAPEVILPRWRAPRVCGDDPAKKAPQLTIREVLPAYAGMILRLGLRSGAPLQCSPRMRG